MNYPGEHLWPGLLGHFLIVLSFVASLVATVAYFKSTNARLENNALSWKRLARISFIIESVAVFAVFGIIYFIVASHKFEYYYAWNHSSKDLSASYLFSCIWEAQEGSFLLWTIWHSVLGLILINKAGKWEAPVMTVISFAQVCLATMIIGIYLGDAKIGINPFLLVREVFQDAPIFSRQDYLSLESMQDGKGLNQLLQNYWMVIHPPILFLGFASTIVPFAYAIAGLWKKDYTGWTKIALPWSLFSSCILGLGIMMGGAWAYESLSFGGFWAWDPVENASLVPWLIMVAGLHTQVIFNATGHSLRATYLFFILSFFFILFSTFLTRSGVLGDSSVHAFVDNGMNWQLIIFMAVFLLPALLLFFKNYKQVPHIVKEEATDSREFWMFIGSLVFFLSALVITYQTAFNPIYNKITGATTAAPEDPEFAYNKIQIFVAVVIGMLSAIGQYLKYKNTSRAFFIKKMAVPTLLSLLLSLIISIWGGINFTKHGAGFLGAIHLAIFASVYTIVANASYIWLGLKGNLKTAGASVAHVGFGMMLLGILIASAKKEVLSRNNGILLNFGKDSKEKPMENATLIKGLKTDMGSYWATYEHNDSLTNFGNINYFKINFESKKDGDKFTLYPNLIRNTKGQEGFSNNPDAKHYLTKDIFTYISYASTIDREKDTATYKPYAVKLNDTIFYSTGFMVLNKVTVNPNNEKYKYTEADTALMAELKITSYDSSGYMARPVYAVKNAQVTVLPDTVFSQNLAIAFTKVLNEKEIELQVKESGQMIPFVSLKVYEFPQINVLWLGTIVMIIGFVMSMWRRVQQYRAA